MRLLGPEDGGLPAAGPTEVLDSEASVVKVPVGEPVEVITLPETQEEEPAMLPQEGEMAITVQFVPIDVVVAQG